MNLDKIIADTDFKIFENGTVLKCLNSCLNEGYFPLNVYGVIELRINGVISNDTWHDTSTVKIDGVERDATLDELENIIDFYNKGGLMLFISSRHNINYRYGLNLSDRGRFVGIPIDKYEKVK